MGEIPPEVNSGCLVAAICFGMEEKMSILQATMTECLNWQGKAIKMSVQTPPVDLESMIEVIEVGETKFQVMTEGWKHPCFRYGLLVHIKSECTHDEVQYNSPPEVSAEESSSLESSPSPTRETEEEVTENAVECEWQQQCKKRRQKRKTNCQLVPSSLKMKIKAQRKKI